MIVNKELTGSSRAIMVMAALVIIFAGIKAASTIIVPFILSMFIAIICNPLVAMFVRYKVPRGLAITLVVLIIVSLGMSLAGLVGQSLNDFSQALPSYQQQLNSQFSWMVEQARAWNIDLNKDQLLAYFDPSMAMKMASTLLSSVGGVMTNFFLILLTVIFMLTEATSLPAKIHLALKDPAMKMKQIDRFLVSVNDYLAIKTVVSLVTGLLVAVVLWALNIDYFVLWGVLAFLLNYIPNIGSIIAAVPAVLLALVLQGPAVAGGVGLAYIVINTVMGNVVEPRFMGKGLGLSTLVVFLSLIFWGWLLGTVGMLLSVPLTMIVKIALESSEHGRWLSVLLSGEPNDSARHD